MHKKTTTALALLMIATSAQAEWSHLTSGPSADVYIDYSAIKKTRHGVRVWILTDYSRSTTRSLSSVHLDEYDCNEERFRILSSRGYAGHKATGAIVSSEESLGEWIYIAPRTLADIQLQAVCKHK